MSSLGNSFGIESALRGLSECSSLLGRAFGPDGKVNMKAMNPLLNRIDGLCTPSRRYQQQKKAQAASAPTPAHTPTKTPAATAKAQKVEDVQRFVQDTFDRQMREQRLSKPTQTQTKSVPTQIVNAEAARLANDLQHNLDMANETMKKGGKIDLGFVEIFARDLNSIKEKNASSQEIDKLSIAIGNIASQIISDVEKTEKETAKKARDEAQAKEEAEKQEAVAASIAHAQKTKEQPLVGPMQALRKYAGTYPDQESSIVEGYKKLNPDYYVRPLKADGHCAFRGIGLQMIENYAHMNAGQRRRFLSKLYDEVSSGSEELQHLYNQLRKALSHVGSGDITAHAVMNNPQNSAVIIHFLRRLACEYNSSRPSEALDAEILRQGKQPNAYFAEMADMTLATSASENEIMALAKALGMRIQMVHVANAQVHTFNPQGSFEVILLHRPGHVDAGYRRAQAV